jgi:hypothetical protein
VPAKKILKPGEQHSPKQRCIPRAVQLHKGRDQIEILELPPMSSSMVPKLGGIRAAWLGGTLVSAVWISLSVIVAPHSSLLRRNGGLLLAKPLGCVVTVDLSWSSCTCWKWEHSVLGYWLHVLIPLRSSASFSCATLHAALSVTEGKGNDATLRCAERSYAERTLVNKSGQPELATLL